MIIPEMNDLLGSVLVYAEVVEEKVADRENDPRSMGMWNLHNRVVVAGEVIEHYDGMWDKLGEPEVIERIIITTKSMFVDCISIIEKAVRDCLRIYDSPIAEEVSKKVKYPNIRVVMETSKDMGMMDGTAFSEWEDLLTLRNLVVHNNSVSDRSMKCRVGNVIISMRPGRMMKGPVETFVELTSRAVTLYDQWLMEMDKRFSA